eukprot:3031578-Pyramimonas_sp.AAC.1
MHIVNATRRSDRIIPVTQRTLYILYEAVCRVGMRLNPDKTVVMFRFRHKGSRAQTLLLHADDEPAITSPQWGIRVRVVSTHEVFGVRVSQDGSMAPELTARFVAARQALRLFKATIGPRAALSVRAKTILSGALASTVLMFSAATWGHLATNQQGKLRAAHQEIYR